MTVHLTTEQIKDYAGHNLSGTEWVGVNAHLFDCEYCYHHFLDIFQACRKFPIEIDMDELAGLKHWHLQGEDLRSYVEGKMDELDLNYANLHLKECGWCKEEVSHFSAFTSELEHYLSKRHAPIKRVPAHIKYFQKFGALPFYWSPASFARAAGLAILLIFTTLLWSTYRTKPRLVEEASLPAQSQEGGSASEQAPPTSQTTDTSRPVHAVVPNTNTVEGHTLKNETFHSRSQAPPNYNLSNTNKRYSRSQEIEASLLAEDLIRPPVIEIFDKSSIVLRGDDSKSESFNVTSPYSTVISNDRPTFHWTALNGASSYVVYVYDAKLNLIKTSDPVIETHWLIPVRLGRGVIYTWTVTAFKDGKEFLAPTLPARAEFKIIEKSELDKLNSQIKHMHSGIARGVLFAKAGLLGEAERELRTHLVRYPDDSHAKKLLETIKSWREP